MTFLETSVLKLKKTDGLNATDMKYKIVNTYVTVSGAGGTGFSLIFVTML